MGGDELTMPGYEKKAPAEANAFPCNRPMTSQVNDSQTSCQDTTTLDNYRAAHAFLGAVPGMNREELRNAISRLEVENFAPGAQQIVFAAVRDTQHRFPVRGNRVEALTVIQSHLTQNGDNALPGVPDLIVEMAIAQPTNIPPSELDLTVRIEAISRTINDILTRRIDGDLIDIGEVA